MKKQNTKDLETKLKEWVPGEKTKLIHTIFGDDLPDYAWYVFEAGGKEEDFDAKDADGTIKKEINAQVETPGDCGSIEIYEDTYALDKKEAEKYQNPHTLRIRDAKQIPEELNFTGFHAKLYLVNCSDQQPYGTSLNFFRNTAYFSNWPRKRAREAGMKVKIR